MSPSSRLLEILIVDSGSTDDSRNLLKQYGNSIKLITSPASMQRLLPAPLARNLGAQYAKGELLVFTDGDCAAGPQWILKMLQHYEDCGVGAVIGSREPDEGCGLGTFIRRYEFILYSNKYTSDKPMLMSGDSMEERDSFVLLASNNFSIKREIWIKIGGMKNIFPGEDILLEIDILKEGNHLVFDPNIIVSHHHPVSFKGLLRRSWQNGIATYLINLYSDGLINSRHFQDRGRNFNIPTFIIVTLFTAVVAIICTARSLLPQFLVMILVIVLVWFTYQTLWTEKRLTHILRAKGQRNLETYRLSLAQTGVFVAAHFLIKLIASISIVSATLIAYDRDFAKETRIKKQQL